MADYQDQRHFEAYLRELQHFCTADDFGKLLRLLGDPKEAGEFHASLKRIIERQERIEWVIGGLRQLAAWFVGIGAAIIMVRDVLPIILRAITGAL